MTGPSGLHREGPAAPSAAVIGTTSMALATTMTPAFLVGALSATIGEDLDFDAAVTGTIVTAFYLVAALAALPMGRFAERAGAGRSMRLGVLLSGLGCLVAATLVTHWVQLLLIMAALGVTLPMVDTGAARAFTTAVPSDRRGIAFGVKEASVPAASMLAGLAVPLLAATVGWRLAFAGGVVVAPLILLGLRASLPPESGTRSGTARSGRFRRRSSRRIGAGAGGDTGAGDGLRETGGPQLRWSVRLLALSFALAGAAGAAVVTFLVPAAVSAGMTPAAGGTTLAAASLGGISARLLAGLVADRRPMLLGPVLILAMVLGASGALGLASGLSGAGFVSVSIVTMTAGWGWTGLGFAALTRAVPHAPATAAGAGILGLALGGTLGPSTFGLLASRNSFELGWAVVSVVFLLGASCAYAGLRADRFLATD